MKLSYLVWITILSSFVLIQSMSEWGSVQAIFCIFLGILSVLSRKDFNGLFLVLCFLIIFSIEILVFYPLQHFVFPSLNGLLDNSIAFSAQFCIDLFLIYLVRNRMSLSLIFTKGSDPRIFEKNYTEGPLLGLLLGYAAMDLLAFLENLMRNLDKLGVNPEFAKQFWEFTFFYDYFEYLKGTLMALSITVLYMGVVIRKRQIPSAA
ncbi:hypothetical protein [Pseudoalteromonas xiamenensis]